MLCYGRYRTLCELETTTSIEFITYHTVSNYTILMGSHASSRE